MLPRRDLNPNCPSQSRKSCRLDDAGRWITAEQTTGSGLLVRRTVPFRDQASARRLSGAPDKSDHSAATPRRAISRLLGPASRCRYSADGEATNWGTRAGAAVGGGRCGGTGAGRARSRLGQRTDAVLAYQRPARIRGIAMSSWRLRRRFRVCFLVGLGVLLICGPAGHRSLWHDRGQATHPMRTATQAARR
jgi:hypothetical protein